MNDYDISVCYDLGLLDEPLDVAGDSAEECELQGWEGLAKLAGGDES